MKNVRVKLYKVTLETVPAKKSGVTVSYVLIRSLFETCTNSTEKSWSKIRRTYFSLEFQIAWHFL